MCIPRNIENHRRSHFSFSDYLFFPHLYRCRFVDTAVAVVDVGYVVCVYLFLNELQIT